VDWTDQTDDVIEGCGRFLARVWRLVEPSGEFYTRARTSEVEARDVEAQRSAHRLIERVSEGYDRWSYNTAVAALMEFTNALYRYVQADGGGHRRVLDESSDVLLLLLAPMAPHITAELWERRHGDHIHAQSWPVADPVLAAVESVTLVVQVNGKVKARLEVAPDIDADAASAAALADPKVAELVGPGGPSRVVARPPNLVNIVL
jgi:leucyl-tRNA synthetase